jgi:hypothetical protein
LYQAIRADHQSEDLLYDILQESKQAVIATHGHGYWIDHWTYNLDLILNYCRIYPDRRRALLYEEAFTYYANSYTVKPLAKRIVEVNGELRQFESIEQDPKRQKIYQFSPDTTNVEMSNGRVFSTSLMAKLLLLVMIKFYTLDPSRIGIMMESDKPGWNDAMNGLPGLFGSGVSETIELLRVVRFMLEQPLQTITVPEEWMTLFDAIDTIDSFDLQEQIKDQYRDQIRYGLTGKLQSIEPDRLGHELRSIQTILENAIAAAEQLSTIIPSFLLHTPVRKITTSSGASQWTWKLRPLPTFLEAPARIMRSLSMQEARPLHHRVMASPLYDEMLGLLKTSVPLDNETISIGRIRAFTAGWLERESAFLHMQFKYLLGILQAGLVDEFYNLIPTMFPAFRRDTEYGRNPLENVSFIATTNNPNPAFHGRGFVARLTGTTTEVLSMWFELLVGPKWFYMNEDELHFEVQPQISYSMFLEGRIAFRLFNQTNVVYINPSGKDTYGPAAATISHYVVDGVITPTIQGTNAHRLRERQIKELEVHFH